MVVGLACFSVLAASLIGVAMPLIAHAQPDLLVSSFFAPSSGTIRSGIEVASTVENRGSGNAPAFRVGFYYSTDPQVTTGDTFSGRFCYVNGLAASASITCEGRIAIPASLTPETYYLGAIADDSGRVDESAEDNNVRSADTGPIQLLAPTPTFTRTRTSTRTITPTRTPTTITVAGGQLFSTGDRVEVEVLRSGSAFTSELYLFSPEPARLIATNRDAGTVISLGSFPVGVELIFGILVRNTGQTYKTGPASRNPDGVFHAVLAYVAPGVVNVGFEDQFGGGDRDFNDNVFQFRGGIGSTPLPTHTPTAPVLPSPTLTASRTPTQTATSTPTPPRAASHTPSSTPTRTATATKTPLTPKPGRMRPLIFIPGIYGTEIWEGQEQLWPTLDNCSVSRLRPDDNGTTAVGAPVRVLVDFPTGGPDVYGGVLGFLEERADSDHEVYAFAYDWRLNLESQAARLAQQIATLRRSTGYDRVDIVAHSMGGLVAKSLLSQRDSGSRKINERLVRRLVFIATPHLGAPKAVAGLLEGARVFELPGNIYEGPVALGVRAYAARNMPAAYQLLPSEMLLLQLGSVLSIVTPTREVVPPTVFGSTPSAVLDVLDIPVRGYDPFKEALKAYRWVQHERCTECTGIDTCTQWPEQLNIPKFDAWVDSHQLWDSWRPDDSELKAFNLYGRDKNIFGRDNSFTMRRVMISNERGGQPIIGDTARVFGHEYGPGDGTVPVESANGFGAGNSFEFDGTHLGLVNDDTVRACVAGLLETTPTCAPRGAAAAMPLAPSAPSDVEALLDAETADLTVRDQFGNMTGRSTDGIIRRDIEDSNFDYFDGAQIALLLGGRPLTMRITAREAGIVRMRLREIVDGVPTEELHYEFWLEGRGAATLAFSEVAPVVVAVVDANGDSLPEQRASPVELPVADAGRDLTVPQGAHVPLDGSQSSNRLAGSLDYQWVQIAGPKVQLSDARSAAPRFQALQVAAHLVFALQVTAGGVASRPDTVSVLVKTCGVERCNSLDDNCDGHVDEGNPDAGGSCSTGLSGDCATGTLQCQSGGLACVPVAAECEVTGCRSDAECSDGVFCDGPEVCIAALLCAPGDPPCSGMCEECDEVSSQCLAVIGCVTPTPPPTSLGTATPTHLPTNTPTFMPTLPPTPVCVGDCNVDYEVTVDELIKMVNAALETAQVSDCSVGDANADGSITIDEILTAVNRALYACL